MTKSELQWVARNHPVGFEWMQVDAESMPKRELFWRLMKWMPKSEVMKWIHQMEVDE